MNKNIAAYFFFPFFEKMYYYCLIEHLKRSEILFHHIKPQASIASNLQQT